MHPSTSKALVFYKINSVMLVAKDMESQNGLGWKGPYRSSCSKHPAVGRGLFHQTRVLKALSSLALNTSRGFLTGPCQW